jgi:hypothetical protein
MCEFCEETNFKIVDGYEKGKKHTERTKSIFCSRDYELNEVNGIILVIDEDKENRLYFDNSSWEYARGYIKINYCPICGRKLDTNYDDDVSIENKKKFVQIMRQLTAK